MTFFKEKGMSDFFQILQREIKQPEQEADKNNIEPALFEKKEAVEKTTKNIAVKKVVKKKLSRKKITEQKKIVYNPIPEKLLNKEIRNPIWLTMFEAAKLCGIQKKTIKRAIVAQKMEYRIVDNRYQVNLKSVILFMTSHKKLWNKLREDGLGQYVEKWWE
jgi:hypothetical protein